MRQPIHNPSSSRRFLGYLFPLPSLSRSLSLSICLSLCLFLSLVLSLSGSLPVGLSVYHGRFTIFPTTATTTTTTHTTATTARACSISLNTKTKRKNRVLVFALYKREAARLEQFLQRNNYDAVAVHGDKGQVCFSLFSRRCFFVSEAASALTESRMAGWGRGGGVSKRVCVVKIPLDTPMLYTVPGICMRKCKIKIVHHIDSAMGHANFVSSTHVG